MRHRRIVMVGAITMLHPRVRMVVEDMRWSLTPIQEAGIPDLIGGSDRLLIAPTGSGKTEAVILPLISRALTEGWTGLSILYVTPLRALNRDIDRRLAKMLAPLGFEVGVRHGDTTQKERQKQSRSPPELLVTTPETAQIMLLGSRLREHLAGVRAIVLDEVHDLASSERGSQLLVGLERIKELGSGRIQLVGLSATVGNPSEVARWFSNRSEPIIGPSPRHTDVVVHCEPVSREDELLSVEWSVSPSSVAAFRRLTRTLLDFSPALVFVNSRNTAETVAQRLSSIAPELRLGVHHGSLAAETRREMEGSLREGNLHGMICTSSLELGIDIGAIQQVHQLQSPRSVDRLLQRVGRSEHRLGGTGRGEMLAWEVDEVAECSVIARRAIAGELGGVEWRTGPRVVAANQFMQMAIERSLVPLSKATEIIQRCSIFGEWDHDSTLAVLRVLDDRWMIRLVERPEDSDVLTWPSRLWAALSSQTDGDTPAERPPWDQDHPEADRNRWRGQLLPGLPDILKGGWFSPSGRLGRTRTEHFSMIPDELSYRVRDIVTRRVMGSVDEAFVLSLGNDGADEGRARRFVMAGRTWEIIDADPEAEELSVAPVKEHGSAPVWAGEMPPVPQEVAEEVGRLRRSAAVSIGAIPEGGEGRALSEYPLSDAARDLLVSAVAEHLEATGKLPDAESLTVEQREGTVTLNTCAGSRVNETLGHFIQAMGSMREGKMGRTLIDPYRIAFQVPGTNAQDVMGWLLETPPAALGSILRMTIPNGRAIRWRMVQVSRKMGVLSKGVNPRRVNIEGLMERYRGTPVVEEALDKLFHERMDIDATTDLLRAIQDGSVDLFHTPPGRLGISPRSERDLLLPSWSDEDLRVRLETRLLNERAVLICLNCGGKRRRRVERMEGGIEPCSSCGGSMMACAPERMEDLLVEWTESRDPKVSGRMSKNAELVRTHGFEAVLCLMGRGIAGDTATRVLRGHTRGDRVELLRSIHEAELNYARTRRYWS